MRRDDSLVVNGVRTDIYIEIDDPRQLSMAEGRGCCRSHAQEDQRFARRNESESEATATDKVPECASGRHRPLPSRAS